MAEPTVVVGGNIQGDITSCKIEQQEIQTQRKSVLSPSEIKTYVAYDVCNKNIIKQYDIPQMTGIGLVELVFAVIIGLVLLAGFIDSI